MAIILKNKFVLDNYSNSKQIGFKFPLNAPAVFNPTYDVKDQLNANITNFLMTNQNERVFNTKFGLPLRKYVFEAMTDQNFETLKMFLKSSVSRAFPNVQIYKIDFLQSQTKENVLMIDMYYNILNFGSNSVKIVLQN